MEKTKNEALFQVALAVEGLWRGRWTSRIDSLIQEVLFLPSRSPFSLHFTQFLLTVAHGRCELLKCTFYAFVYDDNDGCSSIVSRI